MNFAVLKRYPQIFKKELQILTKSKIKQIFHCDSINSVVEQFHNNTYNNNETIKEDEMIIPLQLFEIPKKILFL